MNKKLWIFLIVMQILLWIAAIVCAYFGKIALLIIFGCLGLAIIPLIIHYQPKGMI